MHQLSSVNHHCEIKPLEITFYKRNNENGMETSGNAVNKDDGVKSNTVLQFREGFIW